MTGEHSATHFEVFGVDLALAVGEHNLFIAVLQDLDDHARREHA